MKFYVRKNGVVDGPYSIDELHDMFNSGMLSLLDEVSSDGARWMRFGTTDVYHSRGRSSANGMARGGECAAGGAAVQERRRPGGRFACIVAIIALVVALAAVGVWYAAKAIVGRGDKSEGANIEQVAVPGVVAASGYAADARLVASSPAEAEGNAAEPEAGEDDGDDEGEGMTYEEFCARLPPSVKTFIEPTPAEIEAIFADLKASSYIRENTSYAAKAEKIKFSYAADDDRVNAFAGGDEENGFHVELCGGLVRFARLLGGVVCAGGDGDGDSSEDWKSPVDLMLGIMHDNSWIADKMSKKTLVDVMCLSKVFNDDQAANGEIEWVSAARSVARGVCAGVIGHELGHVMLGDSTQNMDWYNSQPGTTGKQMERRADSFASSILSAMGAEDEQRSKEMFLGNVLFNWVLAVATPDDDAAASEGSNHPCFSERVLNLVRDNPKLAEEIFGFTETNVVSGINDARNALSR